MIIVGTKIGCSDNSGIRLVNCIKILGSHKYKLGTVGDKIVISIRKASLSSKVKKHEVHNAIILRTKKPYFRPIGTILSFQHNNVIVLDRKKNTPIATRIYGPILYEMRRKRFLKIIAIAHTIL
jgi:large subunit ribosomal protein L14